MDNRPVGFFDSGFGGLTALRAFRKLMPGENIIYFGDTGRMPYGARPAAQLRRMTVQDLDLLRGFGVKAIVSACGTTSSTAGDILDAYPLPVTGACGRRASRRDRHEGQHRQRRIPARA